MTLEKILVNFLETYMQGCFFCMPAVVLNVKDEEQLRVDVQPIVNRTFRDGSEPEYPVLMSVPCYMPHTKRSALTMPVEQGDTVLLVFAQRDIEQFKIGTTTPHAGNSQRWMDVNDAVALVGLSPFSESPNLARKHALPHNPKDVVLIHNMSTPNECELRLGQDGSVSATSPTVVKISAPNIELNVV